MESFFLFSIIVLTIGFTLTTGFMVGGNLVTPVIVARTLDPLTALLCVAVCEILGIFLFGHAVVRFLGTDLLIPGQGSIVPLPAVLFAALCSGLGWTLLMWRWGLPTSTGHALVGGMVGAFIGGYGFHAVQWGAFMHLFLLMGLVPVIGFLVGYLLSYAAYRLGEYLSPAWGRVMRVFQVAALAGAALAHGSNDGQKTLAILLMASTAYAGASAHVLSWPVQLVCGLTLALGLIFGSQRIIQGMGQKLFRPQPLQAVCAQTSALLVLGACSMGGFPMSSGQIMSTSLLGAGTAVHPQSVRWELAGDIGLAWLITLPAAALVAGALATFLKVFYVVP